MLEKEGENIEQEEQTKRKETNEMNELNGNKKWKATSFVEKNGRKYQRKRKSKSKIGTNQMHKDFLKDSCLNSLEE